MTNRFDPSPSRRRGGFTLVELLVVFGVIILIAGIALPMVISARRNAYRVRVQGDLNAIATALDAYKNDHKDYPRPGPDANNPPGFQKPVLAWALLGPWPGIATGNNPRDGADGFGFRVTATFDNSNNFIGGGKIWGPYLSPEKFPVDDKNNPQYILDHFGTKIEYLPKWRSAQPGRRLFGVPGGGDPLVSGITGAVVEGVYDCRQATDAKVIYYFQRALGDGIADPYTHNDLITPPGEKLLQDPPPFLLMSLSHRKVFSQKEEVDKQFGDTKAVTEVTNLETP